MYGYSDIIPHITSERLNQKKYKKVFLKIVQAYEGATLWGNFIKFLQNILNKNRPVLN